MKLLRATGILFITFAALAHISTAEETEIQSGQQFTSPDGKFTAKYTEGGDDPDAEEAIVITDNQTGKKYPPQPTISPVLSIKWADSKTFVKIVHIAGGSVAGIGHLRGNKWIYYDVEPKFGDAYEVVKEGFKDHAIEITYKVSYTPNDNSDGKCFVCSFVIDAGTGERSHETTKEISASTYERLQLGGK
jgi:hypothetical protein